MIQKVLSAIGGVGVYGVIAVLLFFGVFLGVLVWALRLRAPYLDHMSRVPLEDDETSIPATPGAPTLPPDHE
jgi:cbb3-type cytochrome oxidase subunit 3